MRWCFPALCLVALASTTICLAEVRFPHGSTAYVIAAPATPLEKRVTNDLTDYLGKVLKKPPRVVANLAGVPAKSPAIILSSKTISAPVPLSAPAGSEESFAISTTSSAGRPLVLAVGSTDRGLKRAVQRLIIRSLQQDDALVIPSIQVSEKPWIAEREWTVCPWVPQHVRGAFVNPYADNRMNIWLYSDEQLARYAAMYDWFGFSGAQLMETCYSYAVMGSPEAFQGRQKALARFVKENGQNVSLWIWAAEFNGYGWLDPDVTYTPENGKSAFDDPKVRRAFEKYYDIYARLAPDVDRLIGHFYDPGALRDRSDVFKYMRLLEGKFKAKNPNVRMSIDAWAAGLDYMDQLVQNGFSEYLLLEMSMPHLFKPGERERFHEHAKKLGLKVGVWGWYTTEYESDQLPSLYVNAQVYKQFCQQMKQGALQVQPASYWSEMEAHHINNIYSMYAASQLLWNPDRDPHEILQELAEGIWGPRNGPKVLAALELIQELRSGSRWETYWWTLPDYRLGSQNPNEDLRRANEVIAALEGMQPDSSFVTKFPLPFPPATFVELMLPHLRQIRLFADFRIKYNLIREAAKNGIPTAKLGEMISAAWQPIPEFNTWIGTFGQPESKMQDQMARKLCKDLGVEVAEPSWSKSQDANRLLQKIQNLQRRERSAWTFSPSGLNEFFWPKEKFQTRFQKLIDDGCIRKVGEDKYQLVNWGDYRYLR